VCACACVCTFSPADAAKTAVGACGCGVADTDADGDLTPDCTDGWYVVCRAGPGVCIMVEQLLSTVW
jgi:hypothetical protein